MPAEGADERIADFRIGNACLAQLGDRLDELAQGPFPQIELAVRLGPGVDIGAPVAADPFDRMLIAQAFLEPLRLVTADKVLVDYGGAVEFI